MNTNSNLQVLSETERMTSIVIDIESQNETKEEIIQETKTELQIPLKAILRKPDDQFADNIEVEKKLFKICLGLLVLVIMSPIIVCDLYFGFTDSSCSREQPDELAISLKLYLLVSGFVGLSVMTIILFGITCLDLDNNSENDLFSMCCGYCGVICVGLFNFIWNIIGAVVFWGYIYGNGNCDKTFSTYVFVSLIIKFVGTLFSYQLNKKKDNKN
jgi:hypothetical protein